VGKLPEDARRSLVAVLARQLLDGDAAVFQTGFLPPRNGRPISATGLRFEADANFAAVSIRVLDAGSRAEHWGYYVSPATGANGTGALMVIAGILPWVVEASLFPGVGEAFSWRPAGVRWCNRCRRGSATRVDGFDDRFAVRATGRRPAPRGAQESQGERRSGRHTFAHRALDSAGD